MSEVRVRILDRIKTAFVKFDNGVEHEVYGGDVKELENDKDSILHPDVLKVNDSNGWALVDDHHYGQVWVSPRGSVALSPGQPFIGKLSASEMQHYGLG